MLLLLTSVPAGQLTAT
jgi:hypothetical protein